jgi:Ca2+-transporting ATPase
MSYILAVHVPIAGMALLPVLLGWPVLLFPLHIAFLELVIDPACSMVFENEPSESDVMQRPPRNVDTPLFGGLTLLLALLQGLGVLMVVLVASVWGAEGLSEGARRAFTFTTLVLGNLALIFSNRSRSASILRSLWVPNRTLWMVCAFTLGLLALALYQPWLSGLFFFEALQPAKLLLAVALGLVSLIWFEFLKFFGRRWSDAY